MDLGIFPKKHVLYGVLIPLTEGQFLRGKNMHGHARRHYAVNCVQK